MAHDRQEPENRAEQSEELLKPKSKANASLDVLADWWAVYGQIYRDDPTELLAVAFRETLQDVPAAMLHQACLKAQRESPRFRPTPGRIYEIAQEMTQSQWGNRPKYLDEPALSLEEREAEINSPEYQELRRKVAR